MKVVNKQVNSPVRWTASSGAQVEVDGSVWGPTDLDINRHSLNTKQCKVTF